MKRLILISLVMLTVWQVSAQRTVIPAGSPGFMYTPPPTQDSVMVYYFPNSRSRVDYEFHGNAFRSPHATTVYGVAVSANTLDWYPYLWVYVLQDRLADSVNMCYAQDTVASQLFCFIDQPPVSYADFSFVSTYGDRDTVVAPFYEFYFTDPIQVPAGVRFYAGVSHSVYNVYRIHNSYSPLMYINTPTFHNRKKPTAITQDVTCHGDGRDSTWNLFKDHFLGLIDWRCDKCHTPLPDPELENNYYNYRKYIAWGFFPILKPIEDSARLIPPHIHPLRAAAVEGFHLTEVDSAHVSFAWDTIPPSDWGPVGVNVNAYQVNYAPYGQDYAETDTVISTADNCTVFAAFDSTVMYKARCRARNYHQCDIHDTTVWGEWSREVFFHTGVGVPDTAPLVCQRVSGLRYEGVINNEWPKFAWERCDGQDRFEVQYAAVNSDGWHRATVTSASEYMLRAAIDPTAHYWVRVRAVCEHHCHIHDTVMEGEWSDTLEFCLNPQGIGDVEAAEGGLFSMAPNPTRGTVTVKPALEAGEYPAVLSVNDTKGRETLHFTLTDNSPLSVDVGALPAGTYLVTLTSRSRKTDTQRLVVEP